MDPLAGNPFSVLTFIAAPAILTNAASVMGMSTSNRIARVVDRSRVLVADLEKGNLPPEERAMRLHELGRMEERARLLVRALSSFYLAVGSFAGGSLVSLVGVVLVSLQFHLPSRFTMVVGLVCGIVGLVGVIRGAALLVWETRLALRVLHEVTLGWERLARAGEGAPRELPRPPV